MPGARLKDWTGLSAPERDRAFATCRRIAKAVQEAVSPYVEFDERTSFGSGGPLSGLPYAAKDMFQIPDRAPSWGLAAPVRGLPEGVKADVLKSLDDAGARRIGFTRMTALAYEPSGINSLQGAARNPWNQAFAPGASSSGSAVAVASGACFIALGSDTGGSLRIPAHGCGITAWKPTYGMVPTGGAMPLAHSLDVIGILARSARDILAVAPVLAKLPPATDGARIMIAEDALATSEDSIRIACQQALAVLESIGVESHSTPAMDLIETAGNHALTIMQAEAAETHRDRLNDPVFDPTLAKRLRTGFKIDAATLANAESQRSVLQQTFDTLLDKAGILALPVMPIRTPPLSETDPTSPGFTPRTLYALSAFTRFANFLGLPAVALPVGFDDCGMPVALQLVGRLGTDRMLLRTADAVQQITNCHGRLPTTLTPMADIYGDMLI
jgi:aspartyl-tRNA(Asn)/glutamyl-tRNA(Gln) amidotransferase subunit A